MLGTYEREVRAADPSFTGFSEAEGRALYETEYSSKGKQVSCASCHGADPTKAGRTPAGKNLKPLAPATNAKAFSDPVKAEKKFDRYCKEVLGRVCSSKEKGALLTWLIAQ